MAQYRSEFLNILEDRGFIHQCTDFEALDTSLENGTVTAYVGYDCTAASLHIGNLVSIMMLRHLQKCGHRPIVLMGGATTKIGDPTDKHGVRPMLSNDRIESNMAGIKTVFEKFLKFGDDKTDAVMVNNDDWMKEVGYLEFLKDYGPEFTINRMLTFDSVKLRLSREEPMTFLEFNYMLIQAFDYNRLLHDFGCTLQMGGSDQWGNIINGVELCRRKGDTKVVGLTTPLIETASGQKMGKSMGGAIWLNADMLSVYDYWQMWRNTEDADVGKFLKLFTDMPLDEIARLEALGGSEINEAKKILANEATKMLHGEAAANEAAETSRQAFEHGLAAEGLPTIEVPSEELEDGPLSISSIHPPNLISPVPRGDYGIWAPELFTRAGLTKSNGDARRQIKGGGLKINDVAIIDEGYRITVIDRNEDGVIKLSLGKKRHVLVKPV